MNVQQIMSTHPACCMPAATIEEVARMMADCDCGEIPVVDGDGKPMGVVTDRDIACRAVAEGKGPDTRVEEIMSSPAITVSQDSSIDECCSVMETNQIRRVPVVDDDGNCCGMVAQADVARCAPQQMAAELIRDVSQPHA